LISMMTQVAWSLRMYTKSSPRCWTSHILTSKRGCNYTWSLRMANRTPSLCFC
jgi:hypothetical protein